jgi:hypothetical protein
MFRGACAVSYHYVDALTQMKVQWACRVVIDKEGEAGDDGRLQGRSFEQSRNLFVSQNHPQRIIIL